MNCPKCKSENPAGAEYCEMCYEKFHRSAAETYMRAMKRAREKGGYEPLPMPTEHAPQPAPQAVSEPIPWAKIGGETRTFLVRFWRPLLLLASGLALFLLIGNVVSPETQFRYLGMRLVYRFSTDAPVRYIV